MLKKWNFKSLKDLQEYLRLDKKPTDIMYVDNLLYTMDYQDKVGQIVTYGNKTLKKGFIIMTANRYQIGFIDAMICVDTSPNFRINFEYADEMEVIDDEEVRDNHLDSHTETNN